MGAVTAILAVLKSGASLLFAFAKTWVGGFVIAFVVAWLWSGHRHDAACAAREKAAEAERVRIGLIEHSRREDAIAKARREAELAEAALKSQQEEHARYMLEMENASKANDARPCLPADSSVRLDRIGRKKAR
jgi:biopolymer transport protein ExbB/TolQ